MSQGFVPNPVAQLEKISAAGRDLQIKGEVVTVAPLKFTALIKAVKHLTPIFDLIQKVAADDENAEINIGQIIEVAPQSLLEIAKLCTGKDDAWFDTLEADEGVEVLATVLEVNRDFFVQRLAPKLTALKASLLGKPASTPGPSASIL